MQSLDAELAWYADLLGAVRHARVLRRRLDEHLESLPVDIVFGPVAQRRARKAAKRTRYLAEALESVLGRSAKRQRKSAEAMQDVLGDGQDAVTNEDGAHQIRGI